MFKNNLALKSLRQSLRESQTVAEKELWQQLRAKRFFGYKFFRQYSVGKYILDFYCPALSLAIEADGGGHAERVDYDQERTNYLKLNNITVLRFWNNDIMKNLDGVLSEVHNWILNNSNKK